MFERFTDRTRRVVVQAQEWAKILNHDYIGTEHLLLGLIQEEDSVAETAFANFGISFDDVRESIEDGSAIQPVSRYIPFTPRAKKILEISLTEAQKVGDVHIDPEHLLLALTCETEHDSAGAQILAGLKADSSKIHQQALILMGRKHNEQVA